MKKIIFLLLTVIATTSFVFAQKKSYLSIDAGSTMTGMSKKLSNNMKANGFGDKIDYSIFFFFFLDGSTQYPTTDDNNSNFKVRYGYNISENRSVEAGFGGTAKTTVRGADASGNNVNYISISSKLSTAYAAYMWKNKKQNAAIGIGPAVSICNIKQADPYGTVPVSSDKNYVLPGVIFTGYWNFLNKKSWFMGLRSDITFTMPAKTEELRITNSQDNSFVSVSKSTNIGAVMNTISLSGGIKF